MRAQVDSGELPARSAYAIPSKVDDPAEQIEIVARVVADGLNREETIEVVRKAKASKPASKGKGAAKAKPRKVTERAFRTEAGFRVTVEFKRGLDDASIRDRDSPRDWGGLGAGQEAGSVENPGQPRPRIGDR